MDPMTTPKWPTVSSTTNKAFRAPLGEAFYIKPVLYFLGPPEISGKGFPDNMYARQDMATLEIEAWYVKAGQELVLALRDGRLYVSVRPSKADWEGA